MASKKGSKERMPVVVDGTEVSVSSPDKVYFPAHGDHAGYKKRDLIEYYLAVMEGALRGARDRPVVMKRFVRGIAAEPFFQKRVQKSPPPFVETAVLKYPSGRTAEEVVLANAATLIWCAGLGCIDINPHPTRKDDLHHPDELRIDLDPNPGVEWAQITDVALETRRVLDELGYLSFVKTSGSRGVHILVRIARDWEFKTVRKAAEGIAREVATRRPDIATARWWKEERKGVFLDFNQNAKDRTVCSAYSVRPLPDARVSTPLAWDEVPGSDPAAFTLATVPARFAQLGDLHANIDDKSFSLVPALEVAEHHAAKKKDEPPRAKVPFIEIARAKHEDEALEGFARWKQKHPEVVEHLAADDVLNDKMRGRFTTWTRIRVRLQNVPEALRPEQEALEHDYDPRAEWSQDDAAD